MITDIEDYFSLGCGRCARFATPDCSARRWASGLADLRRICRDAGLTETVKWGHPCYMHAGRNIALIGALRGDFRLNFFNAALMQDRDHVLERQGPNTPHPDSLRFTDTAAARAMEPTIRAYLAEAMGYAEAGTLPAKPQTEIDLPPELIEALDMDPDLAEAFHRLTPGRQRSYVILLSGAKASATRLARIEKARPRILAGKGAKER
ncbi:MAG: YdeI/OmpD-associated family protein [Tabrizicola sp.]|uniref:YdeI/OmpD-associated family protein n=1 Tax=Tabrizicola sp. TaxID=2005166 RepID=UPI0027368600|nr:YdeI/OmpD-associated family protein [Tabrizicola sp.]MDP3264521.1 YdeI/OmpD-associated family protein [Tabrizicola sp.]MDP3649499.1 YdeI/OmpD-associated family protein [Paracoccaceae bacterium]MDZ4065499.1 YdeI/OmpD-associated family protein [Tabrizicola sp.]